MRTAPRRLSLAIAGVAAALGGSGCGGDRGASTPRADAQASDALARPARGAAGPAPGGDLLRGEAADFRRRIGASSAWLDGPAPALPPASAAFVESHPVDLLQRTLLRVRLRDRTYGEDDNVEVSRLPTGNPRALAALGRIPSGRLERITAAVGAIVEVARLPPRDASGVHRGPVVTVGERFHLCPSEPPSKHATIASATCFVVGPRSIATASHAIPRNVEGGWDLGAVRVVLGLRADRVLDASGLAIPATQVYEIEAVTAMGTPAGTPSSDWVVGRVDRPFRDVVPLELRREGALPDGVSLFMVGFPFGVPMRVCPGGRVLGSAAAGLFTCDLDASFGSSGAPVFASESEVVEGILIGGGKDDRLVAVGGCREVWKVPGDDGEWGERVIRAARLAGAAR